MTDAPRPLEGIRVVEFSHMVMGPTCGLILADLGADVVKIEPAPDGDKTRRLSGSGAGYFGTYNRNKRSVSVNLKSTEGRKFATQLIRASDVLLENFGAGVLDRLGFGYEAMHKINHRLVYCALKGFLSGPYEQRAALDEVVQMMGGLAYMTGPEGSPLRAGASVNDVMGGLFGVIAIQAAIWEREHTGKGTFVRAGLFENNLFLIAQHMVQYRQTGIPAVPMPERVSAWAVYDVFDTLDSEKIFIGVVSDKCGLNFVIPLIWKTYCKMKTFKVTRSGWRSATYSCHGFATYSVDKTSRRLLQFANASVSLLRRFYDQISFLMILMSITPVLQSN